MPNISKICNKKKKISHSIKYISRIKITCPEAKQYQGTRSIKRKRQKGRKRAATVTNLSWFREREEGDGKENEAEAQETKVFGHVCSGTAATRVTDNNGGLSTSHQSQTATPSTYAARTVRAVAYVQA